MPIFQNLSLDQSKLTIEEAIEKLKYWILKYISEKEDLEEKDTETLVKAENYLEKIEKGTLYSYSYKEQIHPLLIKIVENIELSYANEKEKGNDKIKELLGIIENQQCIDQHRYELKNMLPLPCLKNFDQAIKKIIYNIAEKMTYQIEAEEENWSKTVLNGFHDEQSVHTKHMLYLILDELFGIAGGTLLKEKDILIKKTALNKKICENCFKNKLTLDHILSDGEDNWKESFAKQLSIGDGSRESDVKLTLYDLCKSKKFLAFLEEKGAITQDEINRMEEINESVEDIKINTELLKFSNIEGEEYVIYKEKFVELIIEYIYTELTRDLIIKEKEKVLKNKEEDDTIIERKLEEKIIKQYFEGSQKKEPFTKEEIEKLIKEGNEKAYTQIIIKPYLRLETFIIANCEEKSVVEIFDSILWKQKNQKWVMDCIMMMFTTNLKSGLKLDRDKVLQIRDEKGKTVWELLAEHYPETICRLIEADYINTEYIQNELEDTQKIILHIIAKYSPINIEGLIKRGYVDNTSLVKIRDRNESTLLHILEFYGGKNLTRLIEGGYIKPEDLNAKCSQGFTVLHWMVVDNKNLLTKLIKDGYITTQILINSKDKKGNSVLHWIVKEHTEIIIDLIKEDYLKLEDLGKAKNIYGNSAIHLLGQINSDKFMELIKESKESARKILSIKNNENQTVMHCIAQYGPQHIETLIKEPFNLKDLMISVKDSKGRCPLHWVAEDGGDTICELIQKGIIPAIYLLNIRDNDGCNLVHRIALYNIRALQKIIEEEIIPKRMLLRCKNEEGETPVHILSNQLENLFELIDKKIIDERELINTKNIYGDTVLDRIVEQHEMENIVKFIPTRRIIQLRMISKFVREKKDHVKV